MTGGRTPAASGGSKMRSTAWMMPLPAAMSVVDMSAPLTVWPSA